MIQYGDPIPIGPGGLTIGPDAPGYDDLYRKVNPYWLGPDAATILGGSQQQSVDQNALLGLSNIGQFVGSPDTTRTVPLAQVDQRGPYRNIGQMQGSAADLEEQRRRRLRGF